MYKSSAVHTDPYSYIYEDSSFNTPLMAIMQMQRRQYYTDFSVQGNYYPVSRAAFIEDRHQRLTLLTQ